MQSTEYIADARALADLCNALVRPDWVAVDTEFMRERTYFSRPCLFQLATPDFVALVDPVADLDVRPLLQSLRRRALTKVFHSARQDLEVIYDLVGEIPGPVFDTQIAAAFLGYDDQVGYANLVEAVTGVTLDKSQTRTDWAVRPLRPEQLRYAEADVTHLRQVYVFMLDMLAQRGRLAWVESECQRLEQKELYANDPASIHLRFKNGHQLPAEMQHALRALLVWREKTARAEDLPRNWVARDGELVAIVRSGASNAADIANTDGIAPTTVRRAREIERVLRDAAAHPPAAAWPVPPQLDLRQSHLLREITARIRERAADQGISAALLATRRDLESFVAGERSLPLLDGWRYEVVGEELLQIVDAQR